MKRIAALHLFLVSVLLTGCMTPYQPKGATGGYTDQRIDHNTQQVAFYGNGNTPRDRVFRFWIYRCAEVTRENGFDYFILLGPAPRAGANPEFTLALAGSPPSTAYEPAAASRSAPTYTYGGGYTITTHSASGYIRMYKGEPPRGLRLAFRAREVLSDLGPEISGGDPVVKGPSGQIYDLTMLLAPPSDSASSSSAPRAVGGRGTSMDDLKDLLPGQQ